MRDIIAIDIKDNQLIDSTGKVCLVDSLEQVLDFFLSEQTDGFLVVWNLYDLLDIIRRFIPDDKFLELIEKDKVWVNGYKLFSSAGKKLSITHEYRTHLQGNIYDAVKREVDIYNLYKYFPDYHPKDANDIHSKGVELLATLYDMGMGNTPTLSSPISIYSKTILSDSVVPHLFDMPDEACDALEYVAPLLTREWRAIYKIGHWENATNCDIHGAYQSLASHFGDLSDCKIWYGKTCEPCDWGVFKGKVTINQDSPIVNADKQPVIGTYEDYLTTDQWYYLTKTKKGYFIPQDGWMLKYNTQEKPFYKLMLDLYNQRQAGGLISDISKGIAVGLIGQFAQSYPEKYGNNFNPFYSVMATSRCSLKVGKLLDAFNLWDSLINVVVDGCLIDRQLDILDTSDMGTWHTKQAKSLVLSLGHSYVGDKRPGNKTYDDMMLSINKRPEANGYNNVILLPELNTTNRVFDDYPKNGKDWITKIYNSKAISA